MNQYVTGAVIKELREKNKMTQLQLAEQRQWSSRG
jgi:transcriptional regulator with XRE-family HTH domain